MGCRAGAGAAPREPRPRGAPGARWWETSLAIPASGDGVATATPAADRLADLGVIRPDRDVRLGRARVDVGDDPALRSPGAVTTKAQCASENARPSRRTSATTISSGCSIVRASATRSGASRGPRLSYGVRRGACRSRMRAASRAQSSGRCTGAASASSAPSASAAAGASRSCAAEETRCAAARPPPVRSKSGGDGRRRRRGA